MSGSEAGLPPGRPAGPAADPLAAERTALAWRRTALALLGGSLAAGRLLQPTLGGAAWGVAGVGVVLAVLVLAVAHRRRVLARADARDPAHPHGVVGGGRLVTVTAAGTALLGLCGVLLVARG
ncbi:DUF202 domain-containing protein [Cellulomonas oligotrophica]|uniref:Putative membrane protein n=1 Tax=Cellulomonas oligotrophica TaxID=931536 RepID=A0A7Y9K0C5_9CELL|nr:DUF202 domain-containing protein [Cellulomonas oligotrophica]NYD87709.1 putative membrane protein [Cellulomonas oligotrophica]GIG33086.1 hypothetical protein Col01nite_22450 [Cellulomonas oligotrophica]